MRFRSSLGYSDFKQVRENELTFVDKSNFVIEFLESTEQVLLLPRPRRFGKTLNLSMLRYFLERSDENLGHLFEGLKVFSSPNAEQYKRHFQQYPVIFVTFKSIKESNWELCHAAIVDLIAKLYREHQAILGMGKLSEEEADDFQAILKGNAPAVRYRLALSDLCAYLHKAHGKKPIVLIDEYDNPIHSGWLSGYGPEIIDFFRVFLTAALKDNAHLDRAVLTGILRIARESIFSGLNNLAVYMLVDKPFSTCFGFQEGDVRRLLELAGHLEWLPTVQAWYNGYLFYDEVIYNPWSVLSFISNYGSPEAYWLNTSSNELIQRVLQDQVVQVGSIFERLIKGGSLETFVDKNTVLDNLSTDERSLWSLLTFSGYLRAQRLPIVDSEKPPPYRLSAPNNEVKLIYTQVFGSWLRTRMHGHGGSVRQLTLALLSGDAELLEEQLQALVMNVMSFHDMPAPEPEAMLQAFILGLLCVLEPDYRVRSNRESGKGRPDVMILPSKAGNAGVVMELKVVRRGTLEQALEKGVKQIREKNYVEEAKACGADPVYAFAVAFEGKEVRVVGVS